MEATWARIVATYSPEAIEVVGTLLTQVTTYFLLALIFTPLDFSDPILLRKYQIGSRTRRLDFRTLREFVISALQNQLIAAILHVIQLILLHQFALQAPFCKVTAQLPSVAEAFRDIALCTLGREFLYYYLHRILHHRCIYLLFHKYHHQFTPPVALAGHHFHPVDYIITGILPVVIPAWLMRVHVMILWLNIVLVFTEASVVHCGYEFAAIFGLTPRNHDLHHEHNNVNFGVLGLMDYVHGTNFAVKKQSRIKIGRE